MEFISYQYIVSKTNCPVFLLALEHDIIEELGQGWIQKWSRLGYFEVEISATRSATGSEVSATDLTKSSILFHSGK